MKRTTKDKRPVRRERGDGLILRRATRGDADALAAFNSDVLCWPGSDDSPAEMAAWTRDLMSGDHPTCKPSDFTVVEDTNTGAIVSAMCLIPQTWSYEGVRLGVGLPELVGTKPEYRRRGLVRAQFEVIHEWSAGRNHQLQAIGGIPNFYRQFDYEMALELGGGRMGFKPDIPALKKGEKERYRVRAAGEADLPFIARTYRHGMERYLLSCVRTPAVWRYELSGRRREATLRHELRVIESAGGERVGFLAHWASLWGGDIGVSAYDLKAGVSWLAVTPSVLRYLAAEGKKDATRDKKELASFALWLGTEHPAYEAVPWRLPRTREPYAFYIRVADVPAFIGRIAPVLERRLAESVALGYTGELKLSFYRNGVRLAFQRGRLVEVQRWTPKHPDGGESAGLPGLTFLHVLFGRRSVEELGRVYPDCSARTEEATVLLKALFPKKPSLVWALG